MKKILITLLAVCTLVGCQENKNVKSKIGISIPLSGSYAYWGYEFKMGADIFCEENKTVNVLYEDNQGKPNVAVSITNKLIDFNDVDVIVTMFAPFSFPLREIVEVNKVPLISTFNSSTTFSENYNYCYTDFATHDDQLPPLISYVVDSLKLNRGVYYCVNDDYGKDGAEIVKNIVNNYGTKIVGEFFESNVNNHRNVITKLLSSNPEYIFLIARDANLISAVNQIRERDKDILIIGAGSFDAPTVWEGIPIENQNNIIFASSYFDKNYNTESLAFYEKFYQKYNRDPNYPAIYGYTICQYLSKILLDNRDKSLLKDDLENLSYNSIRGRIAMQENRMIKSPIAIYHRCDGKTVILFTI